MSSGSARGRCKMTVPAAEKITTRMISTTPVLIELSVCQISRKALRKLRAIPDPPTIERNARTPPHSSNSIKYRVHSELGEMAGLDCEPGLSHYTQPNQTLRRFHPLSRLVDCSLAGTRARRNFAAQRV